MVLERRMQRGEKAAGRRARKLPVDRDAAREQELDRPTTRVFETAPLRSCPGSERGAACLPQHNRLTRSRAHLEARTAAGLTRLLLETSAPGPDYRRRERMVVVKATNRIRWRGQVCRDRP